MSKQKHWDPYFAQWLETYLPTLGLDVHTKVELGTLPLEADVVVVQRRRGSQKWKQHPLWQHLTHHNLIEFKSVSDPVKRGHFEKLMAYMHLYTLKMNLKYNQTLSTWFVIPAINQPLKDMLKHYDIDLESLFPGVWMGKALNPFYVVEFNHLPPEIPFADLKLFMKGGEPVKKAIMQRLLSPENQDVLLAFLKMAKILHQKEIEEVILMHIQEDKTMHEFLDAIFIKAGLEKETTAYKHGKENEKREIAKQMKEDGLPVKQIAKYTGLSTQEIKAL